MNDNWADILPPAPPAESMSVWLWLTVFVVMLLIPAVHLWYNSAKQKSLRKLNALQKQLTNNSPDKSIAFKLAEILKQSFKVNSIEKISIPGSAAWQDFKQRLTACCYNGSIPSTAEMEKLLRETRYWVKQGINKNA